MRPYTFYLFERGREAPHFEFVSCAGAEDAEALARRLLNQREQIESVEIYDGRSWRQSVARPVAGNPGAGEQVEVEGFA